jgi:cytochrome oxidase Cu insertion factor (SCO1/SenC/PrrC family)
MKDKALAIFAYISAVLFLGFVGLLIFAVVANPRIQMDSSNINCPHISFGGGVNFTVTKDNGGNLILFNQNLPFFGGTIALAGDKTTTETGWDGFGIYFRIVKDAKVVSNWWTFMISLWYPIVITTILPTFFFLKKLRKNKSV